MLRVENIVLTSETNTQEMVYNQIQELQSRLSMEVEEVKEEVSHTKQRLVITEDLVDGLLEKLTQVINFLIDCE
jgi:hypothetical protein